MGKEIEVNALFKTSFDNCVLLSEQSKEEETTLMELISSLRNIHRQYGSGPCIISVDEEYGMILTLKTDSDDKFHTFTLNPPRSSETSE